MRRSSPQFNHPGTTFGTFDDFAGYTPSRDVVLNLVEVGNGEGAVGGSSYWPSYSEYDKALSKGWHVAPTNNQDNHKGKWGDSNTCRDVIVTDDFTEAGLYAAMAERRVYSTEDQNLAIYYYLNDTLMGGIIPLEDGQKLDTVRVKASIADPDGEELGKVEVIGANGITVKTFEISGSTYELDAELPNTEPYYYLKVTQADGDIAVTAPVWVGEATPITADLKNSTALSTVGTSETITSTITNAATANYQISKVELTVTVGGTTTTVETQTPAKTLAPDQKETFSFTFHRRRCTDPCACSTPAPMRARNSSVPQRWSSRSMTQPTSSTSASTTATTTTISPATMPEAPATSSASAPTTA